MRGEPPAKPTVADLLGAEMAKPALSAAPAAAKPDEPPAGALPSPA
jgi:hypothetical protein